MHFKSKTPTAREHAEKFRQDLQDLNVGLCHPVHPVHYACAPCRFWNAPPGRRTLEPTKPRTSTSVSLCALYGFQIVPHHESRSYNPHNETTAAPA